MPESHEHFCQLARTLDDDKLLELDAHYRQNSRTSVDWELHGIVMGEIHQRREFRRQQLERSLWLSSHRGRFMEGIKRWLISRGLWSSAARERTHTHSLIGRLLVVFCQSYRSSRKLSINSLPGRQTPVEQL